MARRPRSSAGGQVAGVIRLGRNKRDYRKGHGVRVQAWGARKLTSWVSTSFRLAYARQGNYGGRDKALNPAVVPTADPIRRAFQRLELGAGLNFVIPNGPLVGHRFAVELMRPAWQDLKGPQLETDWQVTAGWQLAFGGTK